MRLDDYDQRTDSKRVWLTDDEVRAFVDEAESREQRVAFLLGARAGLRRSEIVSVTVNDFVHGPDGFLRVWEDYAKQSTYRETPIPNELANIVVNSMRYDLDPDEPVVDVDGSTVYRWVKRAAERRQAATNDRGWSFLDVHDLRRTWGGDLLWNQGIMPAVVMVWGGWEDWPTFRDHYLGEISPEAADRERSKVAWMGGGRADEREQESLPFTPRASMSRSGVQNGD